jgi:hypothetical protein
MCGDGLSSTSNSAMEACSCHADVSFQWGSAENRWYCVWKQREDDEDSRRCILTSLVEGENDAVPKMLFGPVRIVVMKVLCKGEVCCWDSWVPSKELISADRLDANQRKSSNSTSSSLAAVLFGLSTTTVRVQGRWKV